MNIKQLIIISSLLTSLAITANNTEKLKLALDNIENELFTLRLMSETIKPDEMRKTAVQQRQKKINDLFTQALQLAETADVNTSSVNGTTPLMLASLAGDLKRVKIFLRRGAAINATDSDGQKAVDYANDYFKSSGDPVVVDYLKAQTSGK